MSEPDETAIQRRTVLKNVGAAGFTVAGVTGVSGAADSCRFEWGIDDCVVVERDVVPVYSDACSGDQIEEALLDDVGRILDRDCCEEMPVYYVEWCSDDRIDGWVEERHLVESEDCCGDCTFEWQVGRCVESTGHETAVFSSSCDENPVDAVSGGSKGRIQERYCCNMDGPTERYYIEWCDPRLPDGWVREEDMTGAAGCCDECVFKWEPNECVRTTGETPSFQSSCDDRPSDSIPEGAKGTAHTLTCCGDDYPTEMYCVIWCDPNLSSSYVRQADLESASDCCN